MRILKASIAAALVTLSVFALLGKPTAASSRTTPSVADGAAVFGSKCAICHGRDGAGLPNWKSKGQPDLTTADWQRSHTDAQIAETIKNGKGKFMPSFKSKLSDDEINAVVARIRSLAKK
ncbi:MAG TPA: c-type cytochrome [Blastocatellia bacterium]|jgi:cbb3-type cytochrome c oxidase subunit III|nr:c-type cytochrome [Blastocatellia bacterium]